MTTELEDLRQAEQELSQVQMWLLETSLNNQ